MTATLLTPKSRPSHNRTTPKRQKLVPAARVEELLREIVIALHATRPLAKVPKS